MPNFLQNITSFLFGTPEEEQTIKQSKPEEKIIPGEEIRELDEATVISVVNALYQHADNYRRPYERTWDKVWQYFNNQYDFSQKAEWQAKAWSTKFNGAVRTLWTILKRSALGTKRLFSVKGVGKESKRKQGYVERLLQYWLERSNFKFELVKSLCAGTLSSLVIMKEYWNNGIRVEACDPYNVYLDPTGRNKYIIHRIKMDLYDVRKLAEQGVYDIAKVEEIKESFVSAEKEFKEKERQRAETTTPPPYRKEVEIIEFYGDLIDQYGELLAENIIITIANKTKLLRIVKNPYPIKPFFVYPLYYAPFTVYHKNFFEDVVNSNLIDEMARVLNGIIDGHIFSIAKAFELDVDLVYEPRELQTGIYPGKVIKRTGLTPQQMIREINVGNISQQNLAVYEILAREFQNATSITEFIMGMPTTRGRPTATEILHKSQQTLNVLQDIVRDLEDYLICPMLEFTFDLIMKYQTDFSLAELQEFMGEQLDYTLPLEQFKQRYLAGEYKFIVNGITATLLREQMVEKISVLLQLLQANPNWVNKIDFDMLLYKILESLDLDPTEILLSEVEQQQQIQLRQLQQAVGIPQQGGEEEYEEES